jgi:hypothetical protein
MSVHVSVKLIDGVLKMNPRMQKQIAKSREEALAAFVSKKAEIDEMLTRLQALSDDHFNYSPDQIDWGHVGTLGYYAELLKRVRGGGGPKCSAGLRRYGATGGCELRTGFAGESLAKYRGPPARYGSRPVRTRDFNCLAKEPAERR